MGQKPAGLSKFIKKIKKFKRKKVYIFFWNWKKMFGLDPLAATAQKSISICQKITDWWARGLDLTHFATPI